MNCGRRGPPTLRPAALAVFVFPSRSMVARSLRLLFAGRDRSYPLALVAFVALGLRVSVLGVAWPSIRDAFGLSQSGLGVVLFSSGIGYMATGLLLGRVLGRIGVGR